jgi:predicted glycoside hydrolase/deacetylase ChbG (UPF0249 family)
VKTKPTRYLIVNADDFGLSEGVNKGIIEAAEHGILTSASLMVRQPAAAAAAAYARVNQGISVGLHLDLGEWVYQNGEWVPLYSVVATNDAHSVRLEVERQLSIFEKLLGRKPTHLDSHQHVHRQEPANSIVAEAARRLDVPLRDVTRGVRYCGDFYGQTGEGEPFHEALTVEGLKKILASLPEGVTELGCHPGYGEGLATVYRQERAIEVKVLCSQEIREALDTMGIRLHSFADFKSLRERGEMGCD